MSKGRPDFVELAATAFHRRRTKPATGWEARLQLAMIDMLTKFVAAEESNMNEKG